MKKSDTVKNIARREFMFDCKSDPQEVKNIETFLKKVNALLRLDDGTMYRLLLCCTEAVNNAISHGKAKRVVVTLAGIQDRGLLTIQDDGIGL